MLYPLPATDAKRLSPFIAASQHWLDLATQPGSVLAAWLLPVPPRVGGGPTKAAP